MNELIHIENAEIAVKEYKGQRVVTFKDVDTVHQRPDGTARVTFNRNKDHFIEGEDYFVCDTYEAKELFGISAPNGIALITEQGYLMLVKPFSDELSWKVQRQLVSSYFRVKEMVNNDLTPETQLLLKLAQSIANKELADKERDRQIAIAQETASKAVETTDRMREEMVSPFDNWREDINSKVREIAIKANIPYKDLFSTLYNELESKAGCDLSVRQRNKRDRMSSCGHRKSDIDKETSKIAIIEDDKRLKQIFEGIVRQYAMKYCV